MRRAAVLLIVLLPAVLLYAPTQAQAVVFSFLPFTPSEPVTLVAIGVALLTLARLGEPRTR